jgi:hypothetical protein
MTELQIGLLAIGALVVAGVLAYNVVQERRARREAERSFRSLHSDALLGETASRREARTEPARAPTRGGTPLPEALPDARFDYVIELAPARPVAGAVVRERWAGVERRHARLACSADGTTWHALQQGEGAPVALLRAGLQLVSRGGPVSETELIEFRSAVETLAGAIGATVSAPEMKAAIEAARDLDAFCAEADVKVVVHVVAPTGTTFPGTKIRAAAEAGGLALEPDGRFALRNDDGMLLYTLGESQGAGFAAATIREAAPRALTLAFDFPHVPETRRSFESMARFARQLASLLGGSLVDDKGNVLDERAFAAIAAQLEAARGALQARGLAPGSAAALRLFS